MAGGFWTDERVERLKKLVAEGHSFSAINVILGGPSRSAMIGKAFRLGLASSCELRSTRNSVSTTKHMRDYARKDGSKTIFGNLRKVKDGLSQSQRVVREMKNGATVRQAAEAVGISTDIAHRVSYETNIRAEQYDPAIDIPRKPLTELKDSECRWPVGDPQKEGFGFCAAPRRPGKPYCDGHLARAERPIEQQPREIRRNASKAPSREMEKV